MMIAPPPSEEALRLAYLIVDRFTRYGQTPGTIQNYLRLGDIYLTAKGQSGWSIKERWLGQAILKGLRKAYSNEEHNVVPLTGAMSFWLFLNLQKYKGNEEWTRQIVAIQNEGLLYGAPGWHSATDKGTQDKLIELETEEPSPGIWKKTGWEDMSQHSSITGRKRLNVELAELE